MKALRIDGSGLSVRDISPPVPHAGEALIDVRLAGICNTDLEIAKGYMGFEGTLGHEFVGVVRSAEDPEWEGRRVTGEINLTCGRCERCRRGMPRHCSARTVLGIMGKDGCLAEQVTLPVANLHVVPEGLSDDIAVFTEPLAAAHEILVQRVFNANERVVVLGDGKLGLLVAMVLQQHTDAQIALVGHHRPKLDIAAAAGVATYLGAELEEEEFDVVVDATGSAAGLETALRLVRPRGTLVLKSTFHGKPAVNLAKLVIDEIIVMGSRCGPFGPAVLDLASARIDPLPMLDARFTIDRGVEAIEAAKARETLKVAIDFR